MFGSVGHLWHSPFKQSSCCHSFPDTNTTEVLTMFWEWQMYWFITDAKTPLGICEPYETWTRVKRVQSW